MTPVDHSAGFLLALHKKLSRYKLPNIEMMIQPADEVSFEQNKMPPVRFLASIQSPPASCTLFQVHLKVQLACNVCAGGG